MLSNAEKGQRGESAAAAYLQQRGYLVLARNWRCVGGEIDIVARHQDQIVFIEVRQRSTAEAAFESITPRKRQRVLHAVETWLSQHDMADQTWRIDVIAVSRAGIEHREDAFDW
jgi:putative endonuclease